MNPRPHRILYVEKPVPVGGSAISLYELVCGLDTSLYEPVVLFHGPNPYRERFRALGVRVLTLCEEAPTVSSSVSKRDVAASLRRYGEWLGTGYRTAKHAYLIARHYPQIWQLARLIKDEAVDLVHHNNSLLCNRDTVIAARLAGTLQVCHVRGLLEFSPVERYLSHAVSAFIYISRAVEQFYRGLGVPPGKGHVVHNPVNTEGFGQIDDAAELRAEFGLSDRDRLISNVGRLDWWKGHDCFLQAIAKVIRSQPNTRALIVGKSDSTPRNQAYCQRLRQLVRDLRLSDHVTFTGFRADVPRIMAASDVVVHSASEPEPFGRVIVEAMAAGRPVVATAAGGVLDIIEDQVTGLLVPPKNPAMMARAIQELLRNPEQAKAIGHRARQRAVERFSVTQHVMAIQHIYQQILRS